MVPAKTTAEAAPLTFTVDVAASLPIYQQLVAQVTRRVASGQLAGGDALPSVREVAHALAVNPMTVSKAYSLLETAGVLTRLRGIGMVVAADSSGQQVKVERLNLLRPTLQRAAMEAAQLHIDPSSALTLFEKILKAKR